MSALRFADSVETGKGPRDVNMMLSFSWLDCTIPHDRVYAVRHLLKSDAIMALVPDYSLPVQQLFSTATMILLQELPKDKSILSRLIPGNSYVESEHPSVLLAIARLSKNSQDATAWPAWPTWAPNYHNMRSEMERVSLQYDGINYRPNFNANNRRMRVRPSISTWKTIEIQGRSFGMIATVLPTSVLPRTPSHLTRGTSCILKYGLELFRWYEGCRAFVHSAIGSDVRPDFKGLFNCGRWGTYVRKADNGNRAKEMRNAYLPFRRVLCSFQTVRGIRFGWVPPGSLPEDELCYFAGAPFPFVVRRVGTSDARILIGDAWVYDVPEWDARVPDSVRQDTMASLWPHPIKPSRPLLIKWMELQVARDRDTAGDVLKEVEEWGEAEMGWITLQ